MSNAALLLIALQSLHAEGEANEPLPTETSAPVALASDVDLDVAPTSRGPRSPTRSSDAPKSEQDEVRWIDRWPPERNTAELGVYAGVFLPGRRLELFEASLDAPDQGFQRYDPTATAVGGRVGYYPSRFFGLEAEGGAMFAKTQAGSDATLWTARGSFIGQIGLWSVTPFVAAGVGALAVNSDADAVGRDIDAAVHVGGGLKFFLSRRSQIRVDLRDVIGSAAGLAEGENHNFEATIGLGLTLGRKPKEKDPVLAARPAPAAVEDRDQDGVIDPVDACVDTWGDQADGCPIGDTDGDGYTDDVDACVDDPGIAPDGCPAIDTDGDGLLDPDDRCIEEPETINNFEDEDGCPDELPSEVKAFDGVIEGVYFDSSKASLKPRSKKILDEAVALLLRNPGIRIQVVGYTDNRGSEAFNTALSRDRADAVRNYLVEHGIDESRLSTDGRGPADPRANNKTKQGRAKNRRIEFKLVD